jgi:hypothetical protein
MLIIFFTLWRGLFWNSTGFWPQGFSGADSGASTFFAMRSFFVWKGGKGLCSPLTWTEWASSPARAF